MKSTFCKFSFYFITLISFVMLSACSGESVIYTQINIDNVLYKLSGEDNTASVTGYHAKDDNTPSDLVIHNFVEANNKTYNVTSIEPKAFIDSNFSLIALGNNLERIEKEAFKYTTSIKEVYFLGEVLPILSKDAFEPEVYESATLIVIDGTNIPYPWSNFKSVKYVQTKSL